MPRSQDGFRLAADLVGRTHCRLHGQICAALRHRQTRPCRICHGPRPETRLHAALHRWHRQAAYRERPARDGGERAHGIPRDHGRPREDAAPENPRRPPLPARQARPSRAGSARRYRDDRPGRGEPLSIRGNRGEAERHARGSDRERGHRRTLDAAQRGEEPRERDGGVRSGGLSGGAGGNGYAKGIACAAPPAGAEGVPADGQL